MSGGLCLTRTMAETAEMLGLSEPTVKKLIESGHLRKLKGTRHVKIPLASIESYLDGEAAA